MKITIQILKYLLPTQKYKEINSSLNKVGLATESELIKQELMIDEFVQLWKNTPSMTARPHKLHQLIAHSIQFQRESGYYLGTFNETNFEGTHAKFRIFESNFKGKPDAQRRSLHKWNQLKIIVETIPVLKKDIPKVDIEIDDLNKTYSKLYT